MKKNIFFLAVIIFTAACGQRAPKEQASEKQVETETVLTEAEQSFLDNLASLCEKSFEGKETFSLPGRDSWADKKFVMHVTVCDHDKVHIPFHLDEDHSRTWMFLADEQGLRFRHDHRHEDGTPEDQTLYGGYADGSGSAFIQRFPADDYTNELLNDERVRQWNVILAEDLSTFSYQLLINGEMVFEAIFDLTLPVE